MPSRRGRLCRWTAGRLTALASQRRPTSQCSEPVRLPGSAALPAVQPPCRPSTPRRAGRRRERAARTRRATLTAKETRTRRGGSRSRPPRAAAMRARLGQPRSSTIRLAVHRQGERLRDGGQSRSPSPSPSWSHSARPAPHRTTRCISSTAGRRASAPLRLQRPCQRQRTATTPDQRRHQRQPQCWR